ncbi:MAG: 4Fe-4S dicluster domain-containing protein [Chloroflexota bacterium]|jgi:phenylacetyl-CoA:acceptor oxidoreductase subunit 1|nr:4Fe-4S dicluster domain-containing protein [Anaerolineae bacterium]HMM29461.1 4Fe-4S dicluster domain-containing protein [Aggregatilineaceae bacterium]
MDDEKFLTRREFITALAAIGGSAVVALALAEIEPLAGLIQRELALELPEVRQEVAHASGDARHHWAMLIDLRKCIGCQYCVYACQAVNDVPDDMRWNVYLPEVTQTGVPFHMTRPCMHCQDAPCTAVCPTRATWVRADGIVIMDYSLCIGCRYCQVACPYEARTFNWKARAGDSGYQSEWGAAEVEPRPRGVAEKCSFCVHRIDRGLAQGLMPGVDRPATPACVNVCPVEARVFGDLNDPNSRVARLIKELPTFRLREDLGTEPNVYYVPPEGMPL